MPLHALTNKFCIPANCQKSRTS